MGRWASGSGCGTRGPAWGDRGTPGRQGIAQRTRFVVVMDLLQLVIILQKEPEVLVWDVDVGVATVCLVLLLRSAAATEGVLGHLKAVMVLMGAGPYPWWGEGGLRWAQGCMRSGAAKSKRCCTFVTNCSRR